MRKKMLNLPRFGEYKEMGLCKIELVNLKYLKYNTNFKVDILHQCYISAEKWSQLYSMNV